MFAIVCRHEAQHVVDGGRWWPDGYQATDDTDHDWIPDTAELDLGYMPGVTDTFPYDQYPYDGEHYCEMQRAQWTVGAADGDDWAMPGHQDESE